jgi:hypothetical protein
VLPLLIKLTSMVNGGCFRVPFTNTFKTILEDVSSLKNTLKNIHSPGDLNLIFWLCSVPTSKFKMSPWCSGQSSQALQAACIITTTTTAAHITDNSTIIKTTHRATIYFRQRCFCSDGKQQNMRTSLDRGREKLQVCATYDDDEGEIT